MMEFHNGRVHVHHGDCRQVLAGFEADSFDAVVTDPPYGLQFMGKSWDKLWRNQTEADTAYVERTKGELTSRARKLPDYSSMARGPQMQEFHRQWAEQVFRVLKPGGHMVAFAGDRTYHRMATAIEDAGFEIRGMLVYLYGSGFPKSHDISKAIDRAAGAEREIIGDSPFASRKPNGSAGVNSVGLSSTPGAKITAPATPAAIQWQGWGTALKPALEPICLARKPLSESTIAGNVLRWNCGALNIDATRIGNFQSNQSSGLHRGKIADYSPKNADDFEPERSGALGRWPANIVHDNSPEVLEGFPESVSGSGDKHSKTQDGNIFKVKPISGLPSNGGDSGSAARFFASFPGPEADQKRFHYNSKAGDDDRLGSRHPTVKPIALLQWLCRLITPPKGRILDCFAGTGTTAEAALREGFSCTLVEREAEYIKDIERRMALVFEGETGRSVAMAKLKPEGEALPLFPEAAE